MENCRRCILESREHVSMTATSTAASSLPPVRTSCHVPLSLMTSISEETIALWLKLGALEKLEQAVLDGYGDQLCGKTSRIPQVNKFLKQVPLFQTKIKEIHQAVSQGRLRDVQHLIDRKKLAFCRDHNGASPLHKAVIFGHQDVIEYLVKRYPGVIHIRDHQGRTVLHYSAFLPDGGEIYQYLLAFGADERAMDVYGRQPSYYLDGQNESTLRQLREGSTLNGIRKIKPRYYGQVSAGQPFAHTNRPTVSKSQIREIISEANMSALEDLVLQGHGDRLLGETSSVPKIQSFLNIVPIYMERIYDVHRAVMRDQLEHVVILLENRKLALARDQLGATPLHKAVWFGHYKIAHYISRQFPETLNAIDMEGRTALHYAASLKDNKNMYGILIEAGANKGVFDNKGKTADYYSQYPEHLNLEEVIKRCHKVNANYLANTANRIKGKSPVRQSPPPTNGNLSSPRSDENNGSSKENSQGNDSGNENELVSMFQKDKLNKRFDVNSANIRKWVNAKDVEKLTKAVMDGYGDKVVRLHKIDDDEEKNSEQFSELVERINAIHAAVSNDNLDELQNQLEEKDFALAKDHMGMTPLHKAVLLRKTKIVGFLIEKFPETINAKNKNGLTALHYAAAMSRKDGQHIYKMLLQVGADPKIRDNHGRTPDYYKTHLITMPNKGMMRTRPAGGRHSETLNRYSKQGVLERMTAALQKGDVDLLHELVLEGHGKHLLGKSSWNEEAKVFLKDLPTYLNNIKSFHESIKIGDVGRVKELVSTNEKLMRARDETGALPFHIAAAAGATQVLHFLGKNFPTMLNAKDANGRTALHIASQNQNHHICRLLKQLGADSKNLDQKGRTADSYLQGGKFDSHMKSGHYKGPLNSSSDSMFSSSGIEDALEKANGDISKENPIDEENTSQEATNENEEQAATENGNNDEDKDLIDQYEQDGPECNGENELVNDEEDVEAEEAIRKLSTDAAEDVSTEEPVEDKEENENFIISTDPELQDNDENDEDLESGADEVDEVVEPSETEAKNDDTGNEEQEEINIEAEKEACPSESEGIDGDADIVEPADKEEDPEITASDDVNEEEKEEENVEEAGEDAVEGDDVGELNRKTADEETEAENVELQENEDDEQVAEGKDEEVTEPCDDVESEDKPEEDNEDDPKCEEPGDIEETGEANENAERSEVVVPEEDENADEPEPGEGQEEKTTRLLKSHSVSEVTVAEVGSGNVSNIENTDQSEEPDSAETEEPADPEEDAEAEGNEVQACDETSADAPEENNDNTEEFNDENAPVEEKDESAVTESEEGNADEEKEDDETSAEKSNENAETVAPDEFEEEKTELSTEEAEAGKTEEAEEEKMEETEEEKTEDTEETEEEKKEEPEGEKTEETEEGAEGNDEKSEEKLADEGEEVDKEEVEEKEDEDKAAEENDEKENEEVKEDEEEKIEGQEGNDEQAETAEEKSSEEALNEEIVQESEGNVEPAGENVENDDIANDGDENKDENSKGTPHQTKDHLDELIEHWIKDGDLLRLEHVVLAGQGDRLIERTSDDKQVQDFLDLVPIYMAKIRAVHEAVAKGHLREVRSVLTRKRFALSRDHVGASPLHLAVLYGHTDVSTYIISHFPETMDGPDNEGRTPLHYAAALQDNGILYRLLKAAGADEHVEDKSGHSPKYYMSRPGSLSLMQLLEPYSSSE